MIKIAIPSNDQHNVFAHTGRAEGFVIVSAENGQVIEHEYRTNPHAKDHEGGHGHHHHHEHEHAYQGRQMHLALDSTHDGHHHEHEHGHGHHGHSHAEMVASLSDCNVFLVKHIGKHLREDLQHSTLRVTMTQAVSIADALAQLGVAWPK